MHIRGMDKAVMKQIYKNVSVSLCPNTPGQVRVIQDMVLAGSCYCTYLFFVGGGGEEGLQRGGEGGLQRGGEGGLQWGGEGDLQQGGEGGCRGKMKHELIMVFPQKHTTLGNHKNSWVCFVLIFFLGGGGGEQFPYWWWGWTCFPRLISTGYGYVFLSCLFSESPLFRHITAEEICPAIMMFSLVLFWWNVTLQYYETVILNDE